jgi:hypothetical protein
MTVLTILLWFFELLSVTFANCPFLIVNDKILVESRRSGIDKSGWHTATF